MECANTLGEMESEDMNGMMYGCSRMSGMIRTMRSKCPSHRFSSDRRTIDEI